MLENKYKDPIERYYARRESRWGYKYILAGNKHYGYFPRGKRIGLKQAVRLMSEEVGKELNLPAGAKILDAGCGEGPVAFHLAERYGHEVTGIDVLKVNIDIANNKKQALGLKNPEFMVADFSDTGLPSNHFDGVVILEALVHSPDYKKTLKEVYRILKPGGVFVTHNYVMPDKMSESEEHTFDVVYDGSGMNTLAQFRDSKMNDIWKTAGFKNVSSINGIKEITPMMRRLYYLAYVPYHIAKLFGKHESYTNIYAGYWMYKLRHLIRYDMTTANKPS
jgi:sterol 24-C-methyltransferase